MEAILSVIIFAATAVLVASAPTMTEGQAPANTLMPEQERWDYYRDKRSQYQYISPCAAAAAASSPIPAIAPSSYQVNVSPYHTYGAPHGYYGLPQYRTEFEPEQEMLNFSDMDHMMSEHMPMARYAYAVPAASHVPASYAAPLTPPATTATAYGVFHNANAGGCSVPLLFSCAPSVVRGQVVHSAPQYAYADSYRGVEPMSHHDSQVHQEIHEEPTVHENSSPVHEQSPTIGHQ